jgi:hypothetical protein
MTQLFWETTIQGDSKPTSIPVVVIVASAEVDAGLFSSPETASESGIPVSSSSPKGPFHVIENNDFTETTQRLQGAKQNPLTSDSSRP